MPRAYFAFLIVAAAVQSATSGIARRLDNLFIWRLVRGESSERAPNFITIDHFFKTLAPAAATRAVARLQEYPPGLFAWFFVLSMKNWHSAKCVVRVETASTGHLFFEGLWEASLRNILVQAVRMPSFVSMLSPLPLELRSNTWQHFRTVFFVFAWHQRKSKGCEEREGHNYTRYSPRGGNALNNLWSEPESLQPWNGSSECA